MTEEERAVTRTLIKALSRRELYNAVFKRVINLLINRLNK